MLRFPCAVDSREDLLVVADTANNRVQLWNGEPSGPASAVSGQPGFGPNGENQDMIAIADSGNNRVVIGGRG